MMILNPLKIEGQEEFYIIYNLEEKIAEFDNYNEAYRYYEDHLDEYQNLIIKFDDQIIHMEYGIVKFNTDEACSVNVQYNSINRDSKDYLNGCYGIDAAYIKTDYKNNRIYFKISGDIGYTNLDNVTLIAYESLKVKPSVYENNNEFLIHKIKNQLDVDYYAYSLSLDNSLAFLENNKDYYSYDGHYFYDDFYKMIDDYRNDTFENAVNDEAYYNYYQYLPYRSISNYDDESMENYFYDTLGINGRLLHYHDDDNDNAADEINRSQLYEEIDKFFVYQYIYGCNAMMLLSSAINESAYGRSLNSFTNNNLYLAAAYESNEEKEASRYDSIEKSIYSYAKYYVSSLFSNHLRSDYVGTNFGNKNCGINVNYSIDPYFGEKNSATYFSLDNDGLDYNQYALGIINDEDRLTFYDDENLDKRKFILRNINELVFIILGEFEQSYKIQIDSSLNDEYLYDFEKSVAYIRKDAFKTIINQDKINEKEYYQVHYDFNGGNFHDYDNLDVKYPKDVDKLIIKADKDNYEFIEYDDNNLAQYQKIDNIQLISTGNETFELNHYIDLQDYQLKVDYEDGQSKTIEVNSDMFTNYDNTNSGIQNVDISYNGLNIQKDIIFSEELSLIRNNIDNCIVNNDYAYIKENIAKIEYPLTFNQIRNIDYNLKQINNRNYVISDSNEKYNVSISGLDLSLVDKKSFNIITTDTYYVLVDNISLAAENKIYDLAKGYGFDKVEGIDIGFRFNYENIELSGPAIIQIALENKRNDLIYSVYHLSKKGDIVKCKTTQSDNYVQFKIQEAGSYLVLSRESVNEYAIDDQLEDLSYENMGIDNHAINIKLMSILALVLLGIIGIVSYYVIKDKRKRLWKDFKKSLRQAGSVQEEKPKK